MKIFCKVRHIEDEMFARKVRVLYDTNPAEIWRTRGNRRQRKCFKSLEVFHRSLREDMRDGSREIGVFCAGNLDVLHSLFT